VLKWLRIWLENVEATCLCLCFEDPAAADCHDRPFTVGDVTVKFSPVVFTDILYIAVIEWF
jgi:hypothetical protein